MNKIKELNTWRDTSYSRIGRLLIVKMSVLPQMIFKFNAIPIKIPEHYSIDVEKNPKNIKQKQPGSKVYKERQKT